jgi:Yip1 domain
VNQPVEPTPLSAPPVSPVAALFKVLVEPSSTFVGIKPSSPWIIALLLILVAVAAFTYVNWPYLVDQRIEAFSSSDTLPADAKQEILQGMRESRDNPAAKDIITGPVFVALASLLAAAVWLLLGNVVMGGDGTYKQLWSAFNYAGVVGVVEMVLKTMMIQMKQSANVYTSLALLAPDLDTKGFVFRALDAVDVFSLWFFYVMAIGVSVMCKVNPRKATVVTFVFWAVWAFGIKAGLGTVIGPYIGM